MGEDGQEKNKTDIKGLLEKNLVELKEKKKEQDDFKKSASEIDKKVSRRGAHGTDYGEAIKSVKDRIENIDAQKRMYDIALVAEDKVRDSKTGLVEELKTEPEQSIQHSAEINDPQSKEPGALLGKLEKTREELRKRQSESNSDAVRNPINTFERTEKPEKVGFQIRKIQKRQDTPFFPEDRQTLDSNIASEKVNNPIESEHVNQEKQEEGRVVATRTLEYDSFIPGYKGRIAYEQRNNKIIFTSLAQPEGRRAPSTINLAENIIRAICKEEGIDINDPKFIEDYEFYDLTTPIGYPERSKDTLLNILLKLKGEEVKKVELLKLKLIRLKGGNIHVQKFEDVGGRNISKIEERLKNLGPKKFDSKNQLNTSEKSEFDFSDDSTGQMPAWEEAKNPPETPQKELVTRPHVSEETQPIRLKSQLSPEIHGAIARKTALKKDLEEVESRIEFYEQTEKEKEKGPKRKLGEFVSELKHNYKSTEQNELRKLKKLKKGIEKEYSEAAKYLGVFVTAPNIPTAPSNPERGRDGDFVPPPPQPLSSESYVFPQQNEVLANNAPQPVLEQAKPRQNFLRRVFGFFGRMFPKPTPNGPFNNPPPLPLTQ